MRFDTARAEDVNRALDELTTGLGVLDTDVNRALKLPAGTTDQTLALTAGQRANLTLGFDAAGNVLAFPTGRFRGDWSTGQLYFRNEVLRDSITKDIYAVLVQHTSGVLASDIAAARLQLMVNVVDVETAKAIAVSSAAQAVVTRDETTVLKDNANTSANTSSTQAGIATTKAGIATTQAGNSAISATASEASNVAASKLNLGNKATAPTLDNQGAALLAGATYYDTALNKWRVWTGSAWGDGISAVAGVSSVNGLTGDVTLPPTQTLEYDNRANLRSQTPSAGALAIIKGLGLFVWESASTEPDDDESCFATASGRWLLEAVSWDVTAAWNSPDEQAQNDDDEDEPLRFASSFASSFAARVLTGSATCAITSVGASTSIAFTGTVTGAAIGDRVIATPPDQLGNTAGDTGRLSYHAWVSAANTVTIMLTNASAGNATTNPLIRATWPITVIKS